MNITKKEITTTNSTTSPKTISKSSVAAALALVALFLTSALAPTVLATSPYYPLTLQAGGSTFVNPVMQVWATGFYQFTGNVVSTNYQAIGSGAGITGIESGTFNYAGSDAPVTTAQWMPYENTTGLHGPLLEIPESLGGVAIFYNIPGVHISLNMTGPVIADIYLGLITTWNASAITSLNQGCSYYGHVGSLHATCTIPSNIIVPVHRSDGSGTTYALSNYFEKVSTDWNASFSGGCPCYSTVINWPAFEVGAKGSGGVAAYVETNSNTVGYADSYYAFSNGLQAAKVLNQAGVYLAPTLADIAAAANAFAPEVQANPTFTITNAPGATSYAIATYTYMLIWANQGNQQSGFDVAQLLEWIVNQGQAYAPSLFYPALPANIVTIDEGLIAQLNYGGVAFFKNTTTTLSCSKASVSVGAGVTCKATITATAAPSPTGKVIFTSSGTGKFSSTSCTVVHLSATAADCSRTFTPTAVGGGSDTITASYQGDTKNTASVGTTALGVTQKSSKTSLSCAPLTAVAGSSTVIKCTAKVTGYSPTGTVSFTQSGVGSVTLSANSCTLTGTTTRSCFVTMTGTTVGHVSIQASYSGDSDNTNSLSGFVTLNIT